MAAASNAGCRRLCPAFGASERRCRDGHRPGDQDQLHTLQPICSAQRVSTGITCGAPAVAVAEIHAIDGCNQMGLSPDGDLVETLCQACLAAVQRAMATYVGDKREMASRCGMKF
jgi:hypothetical protein